MRRSLLSIICILISFLSFAQNNRAVNGAVYDENGMPLSGASLIAVGVDLKFNVNSDGTFVISIPYYVKQVQAVLDGYISQSAEVDGSYLVFKLKIDKKYAERKAAEEEARIAAEKKAKEEAEAKAKAEEAARIAAEKKAKEEAEAKLAAERKAAEAKAKAEEAARIAAEKKAKAEAEAKAKAEEAAIKAAEKKAKAEAEAKAKAEEAAIKAAEKKAKAEAEAKLAAERKAAEAKAKDEEAAIKAAERIATGDALELKQNERRVQKSNVRNQYNNTYRNKGLIHEFELGYAYSPESIKVYWYNQDGSGVGGLGRPNPVQISYLLGYRFNNWFSLSAGVGFTYELTNLRNQADWIESWTGLKLNDFEGDYTNYLIPVYLNMKSYLTQTKVQPMISISGGCYICPSDIEILFDAGIGCNFRLSKNNNLYFLLSLSSISVPSLDSSVYVEYGWEGDKIISEEWIVNNFNSRAEYMGISFKIGISL